MFLSDIAEINPEIKNHFDDQEHINYLDTSNITKNFIGDFQSLVFGKDKIPSRAKRKVRDNDLVYSTIRPINKHFGFISNPPEDLVVSTGFVVVRVDPSKANPRFIYEYLTQEKFTAHMQNIGEDSTSTYPGIKPDDLLSIEINLPSRKIQDSISAFATKIDNKIKLNQQMNETLEKIAQTLFKSWFIDFDPVRAKAEGRPTGLSKEISDLFPDSFEGSELGEIPKGWTVENIGNSFEVLLGGTPSRKKEEYWDGDIPWINSGEINNFRVISPSEFISEVGFKNSATKLLPKRSTLIAITGATLGQVSLNEIEVCANQSVIGISPSKKVPSEYVYLWISSTIQKLISSQTGGAQQHINTSNVKEHLILLPSDICKDFLKDLLEPLFNKISNNLFEIQALSEIRDRLLPKLISGELQIPDAENLIEEAGI